MIAPHQAIRRSPSASSGFTLVELLIAISIIVILASIMMFAMQSVMEDAKETRTRAQIAKLNELIMTRWEEYRSVSVPIRIPAGTNPTVAANMRLNALRELMRLEMPDRKSDVADKSVGIPAPSLWRTYFRRSQASVSGSWIEDTSVTPSIFTLSNWTTQFQGAECLYMIVAATQEGDSNGLDFFKPSEIGDVDEDGMPEILDGWGNPIEFLRWAPGYTSDFQDGDPAESPDPFDPLRLHPESYALQPLIFSAGRDKSYDIYGVVNLESASPPARETFSYSRISLPNPPNDPYYTPPAPDRLFGEPWDVNSTNGSYGDEFPDENVDNITNHAQEVN